MNTSGINAPEKGCVADPRTPHRYRDIERASRIPTSPGIQTHHRCRDYERAFRNQTSPKLERLTTVA
jgi:hypothetical protein